MRAPLVLVALVGLAACGGAGERAGTGRVERCVDRLLSNAESSAGDGDAARDYARRTYCGRFERNGWLYEDGALKIAAQRWLDEAGTCEVGGEGQPTRAVPCGAVEDQERFSCALLRHVRRREVREYIERRRRAGPFACDDGTPLHELGVP